MSMLRDTWPQAQLVVQRALAGGSVLVQWTQRWRLGRLHVCVAVPKGRRHCGGLGLRAPLQLSVWGEVPGTAVRATTTQARGRYFGGGGTTGCRSWRRVAMTSWPISCNVLKGPSIGLKGSQGPIPAVNPPLRVRRWKCTYCGDGLWNSTVDRVCGISQDELARKRRAAEAAAGSDSPPTKEPPPLTCTLHAPMRGSTQINVALCRCGPTPSSIKATITESESRSWQPSSSAVAMRTLSRMLAESLPDPTSQGPIAFAAVSGRRKLGLGVGPANFAVVSRRKATVAIFTVNAGQPPKEGYGL